MVEAHYGVCIGGDYMIKVEYNGSYPTTCFGTLKILEDDKIIYEKSNCCTSTGCVWFDDNWNEHVEDGELIWDDASKFNQEIQKAVKEKLTEFQVCCGGCV